MGSARAEIVSDVPALLDIVRTALPGAEVVGDADARVTVLRAEGAPPDGASAEGDERQVFRFEGGIVFRYDAERQRYAVTPRDAAWGEIDLAERTASWCVAAMLPRCLARRTASSLNSLVKDCLVGAIQILASSGR